jgi:2-alkenal reductase
VRAGSLAALALIAAVVGAAAVLVVGKAAGWLHAGGATRTTVLVRQGAPTASEVAAPVLVAKPLEGNGFQPAQIYRRRAPGVVTVISYFGGTPRQSASAGQGSGFVVSGDGTILTNAHVVTTAGQAPTGKAGAAETVYVEFSDGDRVQARVVGFDLFDDVGVIRVDPAQHALAPVPLGRSSRVVVGEPVAAIGSPFGNVDSLSVGVVSAIRRSIPSLTTKFNLVDAIQTDASINHGNSGGPLLDAAGRVIGVASQIYAENSQQGNIGIGFAVPVNTVRNIAAQIISTGKVLHAFLGVETEPITAQLAKLYHLPSSGLIIRSVVPGGPAAKAGVVGGSTNVVVDGESYRLGGDVIVGVDGAPVSAFEQLRDAVARKKPGDKVKLEVIRNGSRKSITATLGQAPGG